MRIISSVFFLIITLSVNGQNEWTKTDRNNLYESFLSELNAYKLVSDEQKESISLCCLETITSKYQKSVFSSKIDVELARIKESTISQCAKNIGVVLSEKSTENDSKKTDSKEWDRLSKEKLVKDFNRKIEEYSFLSDADKEKLSLCCINQTVNNITKVAYDAMIEIEMKQFLSSTISKCAKSSNISLEKTTEKNVEVATTASKKNIIGTWKTDQNFTITFNENGTYIKTYKETTYSIRYNPIEGNVANGEWFLDDKGVITLNESWTEIEYKLIGEKRWKYTESAKYSFSSIREDYFKLELKEGKTCCSGSTIQANKVK